MFILNMAKEHTLQSIKGLAPTLTILISRRVHHHKMTEITRVGFLFPAQGAT